VTDEFTRILDERNSLEADHTRLREDYERVEAERDEAKADAERVRLAAAVYGVGIDPDGFYADTPGSRVRQLLHAEAERDAMRLVVEAVKAWSLRRLDPDAIHALLTVLAELPDTPSAPLSASVSDEKPAEWERDTPIVQGRSEPLAEPLTLTLDNPTDAELHRRMAHPDYEYTLTDGPRKAWDHADVPPPGEGWERNWEAGIPGEGWERFDYHEESYWRRRRAVVVADPDTAQAGTGPVVSAPLISADDPPTPQPADKIFPSRREELAARAIRSAEARIAELEARIASLTVRAGTGALDAAIEAGAQMLFNGHEVQSMPEIDWWNRGVLTADAKRAWRAIAGRVVRAAAPLIPVTPEQRADIERDALLRAADEIAAAKAYGESGVVAWLRRRAASVGTEEGRDD
jgi:hypothetical protein